MTATAETAPEPGGTGGAGALVVIPARHDSSRFPAKLLASDTGRPLLQHTWERATAADGVARVLVAADDERIAAAARGFGADVVMTAASHPNGTSRIAEVVRGLGDACPPVVVNVQGDEPELDPSFVTRAAERLARDPGADVATLACPLTDPRDRLDPAVVKVVLDRAGRALYFSRAPIPHDRDGSGAAAPLRHVGLYAYRPAFLLAYADLEPTPLEQAERLEQLRVLEHGHRIAVDVVPADRHAHGIDTREQYAAFVDRWRAGRGRG